MMSCVFNYEINGQASDATAFNFSACDPTHSVVIEACAGSGKTWLLIGRILRLLLNNTQLTELLIITFTRKSVQTIRERLMELLKELVLCDDATAYNILRERGILENALKHTLPLARNLYEQILSTQQNLSIHTFHSWFASLLKIAPLVANIPQGYILIENNRELIEQAYYRLTQCLYQSEYKHIKDAFITLHNIVGNSNVKKILDKFIDKRAEWWITTRSICTFEEVLAQCLQPLCIADTKYDARYEIWSDNSLKLQIYMIVTLLNSGTIINQKRAMIIKNLIDGEQSIENFTKLANQFYDDNEKLRNNLKTKKLKIALMHYFNMTEELAILNFDNVFKQVSDRLKFLNRRSQESIVLQLNHALFIVGYAYLKIYQLIKAEHKTFDFIDLEWHVYLLFCKNDNLRYLYNRLSTPYKYILIDEFQDTNALQWTILQFLLRFYKKSNKQINMFIVGDPKQSIYSFRRAEPRIFDAARIMLKKNGAIILRTNQTRRNAISIINVLNANFTLYNDLFIQQTTLNMQYGGVWRLPLIPVKINYSSTKKTILTTPIRNPLISSREEEYDIRRYTEGRLVVQAILKARQEIMLPSQNPLKWSDILLLVKKRRHLIPYENALREANIPFISDRRGGLLNTLEVSDLIALLTFLITQNDIRALAHVLKSPIIGASDDDLIALAQRNEINWWQRLQALKKDNKASTIIRRAESLLKEWINVALSGCSVHDLLDLILYEGDIIARYAIVVAPAIRMQVLANINTFVELTLNFDLSGECNSISKFIHYLRTLQSCMQDTPDEATINNSANAVQIMTVHAAKGLEAPVVVILDTNHSYLTHDNIGILCNWPPEKEAPIHFSAFYRKNACGIARDRLFFTEKKIRIQEDWNLLYVAVTRAQQLLIISGIATAATNTNSDVLENGIQVNSWYHRLFYKTSNVNVDNFYKKNTIVTELKFSLKIFSPPRLTIPINFTKNNFDEKFIKEGIALHSLLERVTQQQKWPPILPSFITIANLLYCSTTLAKIIRSKVEILLAQPALERFFNAAYYRKAYNEMEFFINDSIFRCDRVVIFDKEVWILDYKRNIFKNEFKVYQTQLQFYCNAMSQLFPGKIIRSALISADGKLWIQ